MSQLGKDQYKPPITIKDIFGYLKDFIYDKVPATLTAFATLILGVLSNKIYLVVVENASFNKIDNWLFLGVITLLFFAIMYEFTVLYPHKETIQKYRDKNIKLKNNYFKHIKNLRLKQLKNHQIDIQIFWHDVLSVISKVYDFTSNERLSLFVIEEDKKSNQEISIMVGRYSENRELCKKNRGLHPINQGCIGLAWNSPDNYYFKNDFPNNEFQYEKLLKKSFQFNDGTIYKFRMKAKTIGCVVLHNVTNTDKVGVLVFESTDRKSKILTEEIMLTIYKEYKEDLQNIIDILNDYKPLISVDNELEEI